MEIRWFGFAHLKKSHCLFSAGSIAGTVARIFRSLALGNRGSAESACTGICFFCNCLCITAIRLFLSCCPVRRAARNLHGGQWYGRFYGLCGGARFAATFCTRIHNGVAIYCGCMGLYTRLSKRSLDSRNHITKRIDPLFFGAVRRISLGKERGNLPRCIACGWLRGAHLARPSKAQSCFVGIRSLCPAFDGNDVLRASRFWCRGSAIKPLQTLFRSDVGGHLPGVSYSCAIAYLEKVPRIFWPSYFECRICFLPDPLQCGDY